MQIGRLIAASLVPLMAAGCSHGAPTAALASTTTLTPASHSTNTGPGPTTTMPSKFATLYLQILGPADNATGAFFTALKKLPSNVAGADLQKIATAAADAIDLADRHLLEVSWPGNVASDVRRLVLVDSRLVADLRDIGKQNRVTPSGWKNQFEADVTNVTNHVRVVVAKLQALPGPVTPPTSRAPR